MKVIDKLYRCIGKMNFSSGKNLFISNKMFTFAVNYAKER